MSLSPSDNPYNNNAVTVERLIGTAYQTVKTVSESLTEIKHVSANLKNVSIVANAVDDVNTILENLDKVEEIVTAMPGLLEVIAQKDEILTAKDTAVTAATTATDRASETLAYKDSAQDYMALAEEYKDSAELAKSDAIVAQNAAAASVIDASTQATNAAASASAADASKNTAATMASNAVTSANAANASAVASAGNLTSAVAAKDLAAAWAAGTAPGGAGTKSAKEWSETAAATARVTAQSLIEIKAIDTSLVKTVTLVNPKKPGVFVWQTGDFSAQIAADTRNGIFIKADAVDASVGAWVRQFAPRSTYSLDWWGVFSDGSGDNSDAFNVAANVVKLLGGGWIEVAAGNYLMSATWVGKDGVHWRGQGWTNTKISRTGAYGDTFSQTSGGVRIEGFYFYHSTMPSVGATSLANRLTDASAHIRLKDTQNSYIEKNVFWRMPYGIVNDGGISSHIYDNWFMGYWNNDITDAQEGIADIAFIGTSRHGQLAKVRSNYFSGAYNGTRSFTFSDGTASSTQTIGYNVGSKNAIFAQSIEDLEFKGNYVGRTAQTCLRFALTSNANDMLLDLRIQTNFFDNAGNGYSHITTESLVAGKFILGMNISGNTFNGETDTISGIVTAQNSQDNKCSVFGLDIQSNEMFAFVGPAINMAGTGSGTISGNTVYNYNCYSITPVGSAYVGFKAGIILTGSTQNVMCQNNTVGGGGNNADPSTGNNCYMGVVLADLTKGNIERNNLLVLKGSDGNPRSGFSMGGNTRTITANSAIYPSERIVLVQPPGAAMSVSLPANPVPGQEVIIKDTGTAGTYNIQVLPGAGTTAIDGAASVWINTNYGSRRFVCVGTVWLSI